ncbi:piggyBac transposable element-derived protein 3 [Trichinella spiralis]|uniref:piggyBac transposable element-derived protein 3 n=1 Tax=Trichinella spiralis TaxID=6334 RepID=UPI0001EFEDE7|nr:piggyBac transposable element-derived protein 3 [Trichinella spiralis]
MASRFLTLENAIDYLETLPPEDQINAEVCQLPPCEDGNLTDEEHIEEDDLDEVMPLDVCGGVDVTVDSDRIVNEDDVTTNKGYGYNSKCQNTQLPLMKPEVIMKKCRGYFEHACDGEMYVCRWNDNAAVTIASNYHTHFLNPNIHTAVTTNIWGGVNVDGQSVILVIRPKFQNPRKMGGWEILIFHHAVGIWAGKWPAFEKLAPWKLPYSKPNGTGSDHNFTSSRPGKIHPSQFLLHAEGPFP